MSARIGDAQDGYEHGIVTEMNNLARLKGVGLAMTMIDRFYAAPLQGEMNVGELQSKRRPRPWE